jgi:hypothetical protein
MKGAYKMETKDKDFIPEYGELIILENGDTVVGDGVHPVSQLPKPTILHD